jgi:hypothetical protein
VRSIASRQHTADVRLRSSIFRAPCLWIFLSSLQEAFSAIKIFASCAKYLNRQSHETKDFLAPSRQDAKFGNIFTFAPLREIFRLLGCGSAMVS